MMYVGVDGGKAGAIVALDSSGTIVAKVPMPILKADRKQYDIKAIVGFFEELKTRGEFVVFLEKALIVPISGRVSVWSTGFCNGMLQGVLSALKVPYILVAPREWQKTVLRGVGKGKEASILWAQQRYPDTDWRASERCKEPSDGLADAVCLAYYGFLSGNSHS